MSFWVGVKPGSYDKGHTVFQHEEPTEETHPQYAYVIGPFKTRGQAVKYASNHKNVDGTFRDPFCNNGGGR